MSLRYIYSYFPFRSLRSFSRRLKKAKGKSYYASNLKTVIFLFEKEHDMKLENVLVYKEHRRLKHFTFLLVAASDISISLNLETKHGYRLPSSSFYLHPNSESWIYIKRYGMEGSFFFLARMEGSFVYLVASPFQMRQRGGRTGGEGVCRGTSTRFTMVLGLAWSSSSQISQGWWKP